MFISLNPALLEMRKDYFGSIHIIRWQIILTTSCLLTSCSLPNRHKVDGLNEKSYFYHYRNLDSTRVYAERAYALSGRYGEGRAEALNNLAFVSIVKMDYEHAKQQLEKVDDITNNQVELLVADVQFMRLCQRESRNRDFYDYREQAVRRMKRIDEEREYLDTHQRKRLVYAQTELNIVTSTYYYYVGLDKASAEAMLSIDPNGEIVTDTAQVLNYYYNVGAGGIITAKTQEEEEQTEFDYLMRCYLLSRQYGYPYWEANSMQAISEHLQSPAARKRLVKANLPAMKFLNVDNMPDSLLAGNLAQRSLEIFTRYGDVYQTAGAYRTLAECYWELKDYQSAIFCLKSALQKNTAINRAPDLVASIREQLSLAYSAIDDKAKSDYNRNAYLDMQEITRQDRQLEARALQLDKSSRQLNIMIIGVVLMIVIVSALLFVFDSMRKKSNRRFSMQSLLEPLNKWKQQNEQHVEKEKEQFEEINEQREIVKSHILNNKKRNLEQRAKISLVMSITPFIDRMLNEIHRLLASGEDDTVRTERYQYVAELTDKINEYNEVLTKWIQMRQGEFNLHIESFPLQPLFDIVQRGRMGFQLKGVELEVRPATETVKADRTLTLFMINTLADNARKFTPAGGKVVISACASADYVEISIQDTGIGMDEEQSKHIFDHKPIIDEELNNGQNKSADNQQRSHGFGLMNCKGIIDKYRKMSKIFSVCQIEAESKKGIGSRFYFRLPKGIARTVTLIFAISLSFLSGLNAQGKKERLHKIAYQTLKSDLLGRANTFADSAYFSNINGTYSRTLAFADSCRRCLNEFYKTQYPNGTDTMTAVSSGTEDPAELKWLHRGLKTNYNIILDIRNESAVAALALHDWDTYRFNNKVYTRLFRECSADTNLGEYVRVMQKSESNKNVAIILLILLLLFIFPAYYLLYYRYRVNYRFCVDCINDINAVLLTALPAEKKLERINQLWDARMSVFNTHSAPLYSVVGQIKQALAQSIRADNIYHANIELAEDELHRLNYENDKLHISNSVLDNCLSTLKHETMYYPSRIRLLVDGGDANLQSIGELAEYYKELYAILSAQAMRQIDIGKTVDNDMVKYLFEILQRLNGEQKITCEAVDKGDVYICLNVNMTGLALSEEQLADLFTPNTVDMNYLLCRQIVREIGEATNARGCGIQAIDRQGRIIIEIFLTKRIWKTLKL